MPRREGRRGSDPAAMPTHELDQADAVRVGRGLDVGGVDGPERLRARGVEAEGPVNQLHIVVDGLRHANHCAFVVDLQQAVEGLHRALVRAVAAQYKVLADVLGRQRLRNLGVRRIAAVAHEDATAFVVDILHPLLRELDPSLGLDRALEATDDAVHLPHAICPQHLDQLADHGVQARADAAACDDRRGEAVLGRVPMQHPARPTPQELEVLAAARIIDAPLGERLGAP
mmetsp:Transcript_25124/g.72409  ORF Transcript_25124/g.72409 Transcript_25124/m.72409 type:complete len:229 (-) Transcript_25124:2545-3231(-)